MPDLTSYIKNLVKRGYDVQSIKNYLIRYGYSEQTIDQAIYNINDVKHTIHLSKSALIGILIVVVGIVITSFFMFGLKPTPDNLLDVKIITLDSSVSAGEVLSAQVELTNMGSKNRYDVYLKYEVYNENTKERLLFKSETVALETTTTQSVKLRIPESGKSGNYIFQVTARYKTESPKAAENFRIESKKAVVTESCSDNIKNQNEEETDCGGVCTPCKKCQTNCDDNNPNTVDYCDASTNFLCEHKSVAVCGDKTCSSTENERTCPDDCKKLEPTVNPWDELERIKQLAESNPERARQECNNLEESFVQKCLENLGKTTKDPSICSNIEEQYNRDRCYADVAKSLNKQAICENIEKESRKDNCYINFAIDGDYTVCEKISNTYLKKSCKTLKQSQ